MRKSFTRCQTLKTDEKRCETRENSKSRSLGPMQWATTNEFVGQKIFLVDLALIFPNYFSYAGNRTVCRETQIAARRSRRANRLPGLATSYLPTSYLTLRVCYRLATNQLLASYRPATNQQKVSYQLASSQPNRLKAYSLKKKTIKF